MELGQLEAFERAAREGSFTRAADAMNLTQPSISARIAGLETELGGPLFARGGRRLKLTALGQRFLPYAERALAVLADGAQAAYDFRAGKAGLVSIAALSPMAMRMLPDPLERFRAEYPAVDVSIKLRLTREIIEMLYDGTATLGLCGESLYDSGVSVLAHFQEPVRAVAAAAHPLTAQHAEQGALHMNDVYQHTIFRATLGPRATAYIDGVVERARRGSGGAVVSIPAMMAVRLVLMGQGVAFLPESYVQHHVEAGRLVYLSIAEMPQLFNEPLLVCLRGRRLDQPNSEFVRMVKAQWRHILVAG